MKTRLIADQAHDAGAASQKTFVLIFNTGDHVVAGLKAFAKEQHLAASHFTAIGAFKEVSLGYFDSEKKDYLKIPVHEQVEVLSMVGDITINDGKPNIHAHVVLGKRDGSTCGGHLLEAEVRPTLEVILTESPAHLERRFDKEAGLALISLESSQTT
ncbi:MAG: DNA-binding protein [Verrucomicrobia bacterium]|nr:DNA-binding protein [Verrucomicrobiota bacterium]